MEYACIDNNKDLYDGHLQNGPLDGSGRNGSYRPAAAAAQMTRRGDVVGPTEGGPYVTSSVSISGRVAAL